MRRGPETRIKRLAETLTLRRNKAASFFFSQTREPRGLGNTCPRPRSSPCHSSFPLQKGIYSGLQPILVTPLKPAQPALPGSELSLAAQSLRAWQAEPDGSRMSPGYGAQSLRPIWWWWWRLAGACVAIWPAPGLMLRSRSCLTRAERTKRSGPVCARGSSRGRSGGPGAWRRSSATTRR